MFDFSISNLIILALAAYMGYLLLFKSAKGVIFTAIWNWFFPKETTFSNALEETFSPQRNTHTHDVCINLDSPSDLIWLAAKQLAAAGHPDSAAEASKLALKLKSEPQPPPVSPEVLEALSTLQKNGFLKE
jgi:hypothetical protein